MNEHEASTVPAAAMDEETAESIADGKKIVDFISGVVIPAGDEEVQATQVFSRQLVEDYGYPRELIQTRPQFKVKSKPSDKSGTYPVDIAVFRNSAKLDSDLYIVVESKRRGETPETGNDRQIFNYMNLCSAELCVWTDGTNREFFRKVAKGGRIDYVPVPNLPRYGESIDEIGRYRRNGLTPPQNLNITFRALRSHLAGNAVGTTRDEMLATQLINIVFCKIFDEKFTKADDMVEFRRELEDSPATVSRRIQTLFAKVKSKYQDVFDKQDSITLDDDALAYVVGELQPYALTEAKRDAVGEAFEVFIGATLKGGQGQFFTPRNVIQVMVELIDPGKDDLVIDPACGPAGFLVESLRHKWSKVDREADDLGWSDSARAEERASVAMKTIFGIEKDNFLAKVAKAYMAIMGDGKSGIFCEDSLDFPRNWASATRSHVSERRFDVVLANPPFGKDIKVTGDKLSQYQLAHVFKTVDGEPVRTDRLRKEQNPQVLFVERCLQLAKDGGKIGLILPETYFHAPRPRYVTDFMTRHNVMALVDLPHNTFRPFNNAKCVAIIFQKNRPQQKSIKMVAAEQMGHDNRGAPIFKYDSAEHVVTKDLWDDLHEALLELRGQGDTDFTFDVDAKQVKRERYFIPRYYWPRLTLDVQPPEGVATEWRTLQEFIDAGALEMMPGHGSPPATQKGKGRFPYVRVADIINWEVYRNPTSFVPRSTYEKFSAKRPLKVSDVLYVSRGSYRIGDVAMVGPNDTEAMITREIHILRTIADNSEGLDPFYLLYLLTTPQVATQTASKVFIDTTLPTIADRYLRIKLPWAKDEGLRQEISIRIGAAVTKRWSAMSEIRSLIDGLRPEEDGPENEGLFEPVDSSDPENESIG